MTWTAATVILLVVVLLAAMLWAAVRRRPEPTPEDLDSGYPGTLPSADCDSSASQQEVGEPMVSIAGVARIRSE